MTILQRIKRRATSEAFRLFILVYPLFYTVFWVLALPFALIDPWAREDHLRCIGEAYSLKSWKGWLKELRKGTITL